MGRRRGRAGNSPATIHDATAEMTLVEHLDELRRRLIMALIPWLLFSIAGFFAAGRVLAALKGPMEQLVILSPGEGFLIHLRLGIYMGTALASPIILYQGVAFVQPALTRQERRQLLLSLPVAFLLLVLGVAFGFWVILPFVLRFFLSFTGPDLVPLISVSSYVSFVIGTVTPFAVVFQLPVVVWVTSRLGVIDHHLLRRIRRWAIFIIFVAAAFLTPPDVVSQVLMAVPLLILYELSILLARVGARQRQRELELHAAGDDDDDYDDLDFDDDDDGAGDEAVAAEGDD